MRGAEADRQQPIPLQFPRGGGDQFSIGRDASCDLAIPHMTVSRRHAQLERTKDGWLITDLESTNGTRVNGWRVRGKVPVRAGDVVSFGNLETVFWRGDDPVPVQGADPPAHPAMAVASPPCSARTAAGGGSSLARRFAKVLG